MIVTIILIVVLVVIALVSIIGWCIYSHKLKGGMKTSLYPVDWVSSVYIDFVNKLTKLVESTRYEDDTVVSLMYIYDVISFTEFRYYVTTPGFIKDVIVPMGHSPATRRRLKKFLKSPNHAPYHIGNEVYTWCDENIPRHIMQQCLAFWKLGYKYVSDEDDDFTRAENLATIFESVIYLYINHDMLLKPISILGIGASNIAIKCSANGREYVLRCCSYGDGESAHWTTKKSDMNKYQKTLKQSVRIMQSRPDLFAPIYHGSYEYDHYPASTLTETRNFTVSSYWILTDYLEPINYMIFNTNHELTTKYFATMINIIHLIEPHQLTYTDWKLLNFMYNPRNDSIVLSDIDLNRTSDFRFPRSHKLGFDQYYFAGNRDERVQRFAKAILMKEIIAVIDASSSTNINDVYTEYRGTQKSEWDYDEAKNYCEFYLDGVFKYVDGTKDEEVVQDFWYELMSNVFQMGDDEISKILNK